MDQDPLQVLYLDEHCVAVHKPAGLLVHRSRLSRDEVFLLQRLRDQIGRRVYPVHRLDRATSGVIVFGLTPDDARQLQRVLQGAGTRKIYLAVVRGWMLGDELVDHELDDRESGLGPRAARTRVTPLALTEIDASVDRYPTARYSLVQAEPLTGRRHQIRRHLKHLSHPIIGDTTWGKGTHNRFFRENFVVNRLLLTARELRFAHPVSGSAISIKAAPEPEWEELMSKLGWGSA